MDRPNWLRRLFPDPNEKQPCDECGAMILRRTHKENHGFCAPCARMTPESRARRRAFDASIKDGTQFRLSRSEQASAAPLPVATWRVDAEDVPHIADKTVQSVANAARAGTASVHFRGPNEAYLSLEQKDDWAILTTFTADAPGVQFVHGPMAAAAQLNKDAQLWLACPCCGQGSACAPSKFHLPRDAAIAALDHILAGTTPAHFQLITADDFIRVMPGHG